MDIPGLPPHRTQEAALVSLRGQARQLDAAGIRREAAIEPAFAHLGERVRAADRGSRQVGVVDAAARVVFVRPFPRRRRDRLGLVCDGGALPVGDRHQPLAAEAAQARPAADESDARRLGRKPPRQLRFQIRLERAARARERMHARPEGHRVAKPSTRQLAQPAVVLGEDEGAAAHAQRSCVPVHDGRARLLEVDVEVTFRSRKAGARGQAHEVEGEGNATCLVEVADAPDQPTFDIAPRPVGLDVEVAYRQHADPLRNVRQGLRRELRPPIEGRAKKAEGVRRHHLVLVVELLLAHAQMSSKPPLEAAGRFRYVGGLGHLRVRIVGSPDR